MESLRECESKLWQLFKQGDDGAFSAIYNHYSTRLYYYGLKFTRNRTLIEDTLHDLFYELIRNRKSIGHTDSIFPYLLTSFRRKLFRKLKSESRYNLQGEQEEYEFDVMYSIEHEIILEEHSLRRKDLFARALQQLSPRQKEAIYLRFTSELEYGEISSIMEMSLEACRNLICRAIRALKENLPGDT